MGNPKFSQMNVRDIPWQYVVKKFMREDYDYKKNGKLQIMLSGSVGSAKSIFACNMGISHCLMYSDAVLGLFRLAMPDLKETIYSTFLEHLEGTEIEVHDNGKIFRDTMREGVHYTASSQKASIDFSNGAKVRSKSWSDQKWGKLRSHNYSAGILEEYTENSSALIEQAYTELVTRIGRISSRNSNVRENWLMSLTNPDGESHYGFEYFMQGAPLQTTHIEYKHKLSHLDPEHALYNAEFDFKKDVMWRQKGKNRFVYYSLTEDNIFLDPNYVEDLKGSLSPIQYRRKLRGEWIDDQSDKIYSSYSQEKNLKQFEYKPNTRDDIWCSWDFNTGEGKPMSAVVAQYEKKADHWHFFGESIIKGSDTYEILEDMAARGFFDYQNRYILTGDGTGDAKTANSKKSNWVIIREFFENYRTPDGRKVDYRIVVKMSNPPVRQRHNDVNAYLENAKGQYRTTLYVWDNPKASIGNTKLGCPTLDKGMRLTVLKKGGAYIEDDGPAHPYQHCTTSMGYMICSAIKFYNEQQLSYSTQR